LLKQMLESEGQPGRRVELGHLKALKIHAFCLT
jgi:hypothetical protein